MCYVSMVMDDYSKRIPWTVPEKNPLDFIITGPTYNPPVNITMSNLQKEDIDRLEKLIAEFKEAVDLANRLDVLTKKPDCIDPEKEKLIARVTELEQQLNKIKLVFQEY